MAPALTADASISADRIGISTTASTSPIPSQCAIAHAVPRARWQCRSLRRRSYRMSPEPHAARPPSSAPGHRHRSGSAAVPGEALLLRAVVEFTLVTLAVALRNEGPTSSASSSTTVCFSPSRVSKDRCLRRPVTMTRAPRSSDSATFSAGSRHSTQRKNNGSPSRHSPARRSKNRGVEATVNWTTATPAAVNFSSGAAVRFPFTVMTVSPVMIYLPQDGNPQAGWQNCVTEARAGERP